MSEPQVSMSEAFAQFNEILEDAHAWVLGQRAKFAEEGFSETAAEHMTMELWSAWVRKAFA